MQSEPSSVSSSDVLRSHLSSVHSIANATPTEVAASFQAKVQENLMLKEQIIQLQNSLKVVKESMELQAAEFAFQRSEYEYELESAKTIEAELRSALLKASQGKAEIMREVEEKYRKQIDAGERQRNEYLQNLQGQVTRMRNKLVEMQGENEAIKDDYEKACQANTDLKNQLDDQHEVYTAKVAMLEKHIEVLQAETSKVIGELRAKTTDLEKSNAKDENDLRAAQRKIDELGSQLAVAAKNLELREQQTQKLKEEHNKLSTQLAEECTKHGKTRSMNEALQTRINVLETEVKTVNRMMAEIDDKTKAAQAVWYCSPIQRTRIDILKIIHNAYSKLVKQVYAIYPEIPQRESEFRPVVLMVLFVNRWGANTGNEKEICDHSSGLLPFESRMSFPPGKLLINAKNDVLTCMEVVREQKKEKKKEDRKLANLTDQEIRQLRSAEATSLHLATAKKCNRTLHKQLKSFIEFHKEMTQSDMM